MARLFTVEEANALIPFLEQRLARLNELRLLARDVSEELADLEMKARSNGSAHAGELEILRERLDEYRREIRSVVEEIADLGGEIKSIEEGLIDFPARREGRVVYLCWKQGEDRIHYWHELDAGFAGRKPLNDGFGRFES
jgi:hypothetical protein